MMINESLASQCNSITQDPAMILFNTTLGYDQSPSEIGSNLISNTKVHGNLISRLRMRKDRAVQHQSSQLEKGSKKTSAIGKHT